MSDIVYTHRGFPVNVKGPGRPTVFESPEVAGVYKARYGEKKRSFAEEIDQIKILADVWDVMGNVFANVDGLDAKLSGNVRSFLADTALYVTSSMKRRRIDITVWWDMLQPETPETERQAPEFTEEEAKAIDRLAGMSTEYLFQQWITAVGIDDLVQSLNLIAGPLAVK